MPHDTHTVTADELFRMPDDGYHRYELVRGRLLAMTPAGTLHGLIASRLHVALAAHVDANRLGIVLSADTGFRLQNDPDTVRAPDVAFIALGRIPAEGIPDSFWSGAPDLAVEVLSPSDIWSELQDKISEYLSLGTREVWVVEPLRGRVTVYRAGEQPNVLQQSDTLDGGTLLPGFQSRLARLFTSEI